MSAKLSLNLGLRYDFITPALRGQQPQANFDPAGRPAVFSAKDGSLEDRGLVEPDKNNFAPRVGFVYQLERHAWSLRGGYGIFYNLFDRIGSEDQIALNPGTGLVNLQPVDRERRQRAAVPAAQRLPAGTTSTRRGSTCSRAVHPRRGPATRRRRTMHQFSVGAAADVRAGLHALDRLRRHRGPQPGEPDQPQPATPQRGRQQRARPAAVSRRSGPRSSGASRTGESSYKGMDLALQKRFSERLRLRPRLHALRLRRTTTAEHLATGGSPSRSQNAHDLEAWRGPVRLRHAAPPGRATSSPSCRSPKQATGVERALLGDWTISGHLRRALGPAVHRDQGSNNVGHVA